MIWAAFLLISYFIEVVNLQIIRLFDFLNEVKNCQPLIKI